MKRAPLILYCEWCGRALTGHDVTDGYCPVPTCVMVRSQRVEQEQSWTEDESRWWHTNLVQMSTYRTVSRCGVNVRLALRKFGQLCVYIWKEGGPSLSVDVGQQSMPVQAIVREIQALRTCTQRVSIERDKSGIL